MPVPGSLIVPDPRPPSVFLLGAGALLLAGLVIRTLRRRRGRVARPGSHQSSSQGAIVLGSWRPVAEASAPLELPLRTLRPLAVAVPVGRMRGEEGAQKRGRATKKRP
ncbi:MAG TPA: hypothetical protein VF815_21860 [Myxococcaceae bacterium]|jgi:hypothetical protein